MKEPPGRWSAPEAPALAIARRNFLQSSALGQRGEGTGCAAGYEMAHNGARHTRVKVPFTSGQSYTILKDATFSDVGMDYWAWQYVEQLVNAAAQQEGRKSRHSPRQHQAFLRGQVLLKCRYVGQEANFGSNRWIVGRMVE